MNRANLKKKTKKELKHEFFKKYGKIPTDSELKQYKSYLDNFSFYYFLDKMKANDSGRRELSQRFTEHANKQNEGDRDDTNNDE